ncbi:hypothetical protein D9619_001207 [Psilocybe cf. subviscida]|uniref:Uncharacterized protein n=1 Tax=Psilocybe cf. subviscida TaxID=2480587 RepID=A0A8H5F229_9AGAR|nr:hypothetical protein D9619_001207 [Psilocybe cf. subviscida]
MSCKCQCHGRPSKASHDWNILDLNALKIEIVDDDTQTFFGVEDLPSPRDIPHAIWDNATAPAGELARTEKYFFAYLQDAMHPPVEVEQESHIVDFAAFLLGLLGYDHGSKRVLHTRKNMPFLMNGEYVWASADVALVERIASPKFEYLLLVHEDKTDYGLSPPANFPEPHLIAQAFAAFYQNNKLRWSLGRPRLETETFLGIIFSRTAPSFYKITITKAVAQAMEGGISPEETTVVHKFTPRVRGEDGFLVHGMGHLESRRMVFRYLEAFKKFVPKPPL